MKNLKYIQLFEAFESNKLSKTLKFIDKKDRNIFLNHIKSICDSRNFPLSEISDDLFEYLPFRKALSLHKDPVQKKCTATSQSEFNFGVALPGEKCEEGKLKRSWGVGRVRVMQCPKCNGTGIEPFKEKLEYVKFWFSIDKKYIEQTATTGVTYGDGKSLYRYDRIVYIRYNSINLIGLKISEENIENSLKDANFALILDLDKLYDKSEKVKNTKLTKDIRYKNRENAIALQSNNDIKEQNIRRYFDKLIERSKIKGNLDDIKNLNKLILRLMCGSYPLFTLNKSSNVNSMRMINDIGEDIYDIMIDLEKDQEHSISQLNRVNTYIETYLTDLKQHKIKIDKSLEMTKLYVNSYPNVSSKLLFNNIMEINNLIYNYVVNYKIETLYDYESLLADLTTITNLLNEKRYLYDIKYFFDRTTSTWSWDDAKFYLTDIYLSTIQIESGIEGTNRFIKFLKNKYSL
jgi:hypothetical protein